MSTKERDASLTSNLQPLASVVEARGLTKVYNKQPAVDAIDFSVRRSETFGLLGPNGAGKSTTMRMIACRTPLTSGELLVEGLDVRTQGRQIRSLIGVVPQENNLDPDLNVIRNLIVYASYFRIPRTQAAQRANELLHFIGLSGRADARIDHLSGGMKRRLMIARALLHEPRLLVLDEPTTGLDPQARLSLWDVVDKFRGGGGTVLLTTHYMEEATRLCDRVAIMDHGKIITLGTPLDLIESLGADQIIEFRVTKEIADDALTSLPAVSHLHKRDDDYSLTVAEMGVALPALLAEIKRQRSELVSLTTHQATLEDVFVSLTGRMLREG